MKKIREEILRNKSVFIGLEDSKRSWKLSARCESIEVYRGSMPAKYSNLIHFLQHKFPECHIELIYEAGFKGFTLYDRLIEDGITCIVIPPHLVTEEKGNKVKTDKRDASRLARILENKDYKNCCHVPTKERREDRQISRTIDQLQKELVATKNRIKQFFHFYGLESGLPDQEWSQKNYEELSRLELPEMLQKSLHAHLRILKALHEEIKDLKNVLQSLCRKPAYAQTVKLFQSVPGIGWLTAIRFALEWGDLSRFSSGKKFASFLGLGCSEHSTGENQRKGRITKLGNRQSRCWLVESAWTAIKKDPLLLEKFQNVASSSKRKNVAIVAVARKLAVRLRTIYLTKTPYVIGVVK